MNVVKGEHPGLRLTVIVNTIALWASLIGAGVYLVQGGAAYGKQTTKIEALESALPKIETQFRLLQLDLMEAVEAHKSLPGHSGSLQTLAANDERIKQIKETTDEIKQDLKTLIKEIREDRG